MVELPKTWFTAALGIAALAAAGASCSKGTPEPPSAQPSADSPASAVAGSVAGSAKATPSARLLEPTPFDFQLGPLPGAMTFEGTIKLQVVTDSNPGRPEIMTFAVRGNRARWNLAVPESSGGAGSYRIYDGDAHRFYTVVPERKTAFMTDETSLGASAGGSRSYPLTPDAQQPKTVVQGHPCDRMVTRDDQAQYSVCLAKKLGNLPLYLLGQDFATLMPFGKAIAEQGLFPLDVTARQSGTGPAQAAHVIGTLTVVEMTRGSVPDIAYGIPHPFARVSAPTLDLEQLLR